MFMGEHLGQATAKSKPPTHTHALPHATARFRPRRSTRAKFSPFSVHYLRLTTHQSRVTNHVFEGGTVNRPRTHVNHRKLTIAHMQGRNSPVHFLLPFSARFLSALRANLPDTLNRVETHLSHRKQTTAHASTRNVPAHRVFHQIFACCTPTRRAARKAAALHSSDAPATGARSAAICSREQGSRIGRMLGPDPGRWRAGRGLRYRSARA
jgi:hypothetical protein